MSQISPAHLSLSLSLPLSLSPPPLSFSHRYKIDRGGLKSGVYYYDLFLALTTLVMEAGMKKKGEVLRQISTESPEVAKIRKAVQNKDCEPTRDLLGNL